MVTDEATELAAILAAQKAADDRDEWTIHVYRDHPDWDRHEKWFMLPDALLKELYVATYTYRGYGRPTEACRSVQALRREHPGCVFVY